MPTVLAEAHLSADEMLKAAKQMELAELTRFVADAISLWAKRQRIRLARPEKRLLRRIKQALPAELRKRYRELIEKRRDETLTSPEYRELLRLTNEVEKWEADRLTALVELASFRNTSLEALMKDLGIQAPSNG
jgi:hypothetical protein